MKDVRIDNRKDILLLLLYSPGQTKKVNEPIVGRTRLVKMLYLFRKEALKRFKKGTDINEDNFYEFFAWEFGPFSTQVYDDITFFVLRSFIQISGSKDEDPLPESAAEWAKWLSDSGIDENEDLYSEYQEEGFSLTTTGLDFTQPYFESLSDAQRTLLREFKSRLSSAPLRAILRYVYETYPETTEKSKIRDEVLSDG